jgi:hypothetical protein
MGLPLPAAHLLECCFCGADRIGVPGVQKFVRETAELPFSEMKQGILDRVAAWREGPPSDDVSLVLVEVL